MTVSEVRHYLFVGALVDEISQVWAKYDGYITLRDKLVALAESTDALAALETKES